MKHLLYAGFFSFLLYNCSYPHVPKYKDPSLPVDTRVNDLLKRMTLDEKVAQLQAVVILDSLAFDGEGNFRGGKDTTLLKNGAGTVWAWDNKKRTPRMETQMNNSIQKYLLEKTRLGIPALSFGESVHGYMADGSTSFPQAIALGSTWDTALIEKVFTAAALEASSRGTNQVLSPVLDLARDPRWGRSEECYSEDPYLASRIGLAAVHGLQGRNRMVDSNHVVVTLKHFAGHGQPEGGRNTAPVNYSEREFRETHLYPFEIAVKRGYAHSIMASYNEWDGVPNHLNHKLLIDILTNEWGFDGYVMTDGGGLDMVYLVHHAAADPAEAGILGIKAGIDYDLFSHGCFKNLAQEVKNQLVPEEVLDRAVRNVLKVKFMRGLFENPYGNIDRMERVTNCNEHKELALKAAHEAIILLKNSKNTLPFDSTKVKTIAVIGPDADSIHLGGYSTKPMHGISVLEGIRQFAGKHIKVLYAQGCKITANKECNWLVNEAPVMNDPEKDKVLIKEAVKVAKQSDVVLLVIGENELIDREAYNEQHLGDRDDLNLAGMQNELAQSVIATGKPVAVLLINGRVITINEIQKKAPAILEGWYLGQETGIAVADVIFGKVNPSGKLTVTFPRSVGQLPCYYDMKPSRSRDYTLTDNTPLYPFGFGLSYTSFKYSKLQLSSKKIATDGNTEASVNVTNTGNQSGDEIVQLYIHDIVSMPTRPIMELKDFTRITLAAGETKSVKFLVTPEKLEAMDIDMKRKVAPGDFEIMIGGSSANVLRDTLRVVAK